MNITEQLNRRRRIVWELLVAERIRTSIALGGVPQGVRVLKSLTMNLIKADRVMTGDTRAETNQKAWFLVKAKPLPWEAFFAANERNYRFKGV